MECEHCGARMMLMRHGDGRMCEVQWYRCHTCDTGRMVSVAVDALPGARNRLAGARRLFRRLSPWRRR